MTEKLARVIGLIQSILYKELGHSHRIWKVWDELIKYIKSQAFQECLLMKHVDNNLSKPLIGYPVTKIINLNDINQYRWWYIGISQNNKGGIFYPIPGRFEELFNTIRMFMRTTENFRYPYIEFKTIQPQWILEKTGQFVIAKENEDGSFQINVDVPIVIS